LKSKTRRFIPGNTGSWFKTYVRENETVLMQFRCVGEDTIEIASSTVAGVPRAHLRTYSNTGSSTSTAGYREVSFPVGRLDALCDAVLMLREQLGNESTAR
jgi:hypothetical protein